MVKNKLKLMIWDWNGTLLDDTELCYSIANLMRMERNMEPLLQVDSYREMFGFPVIDYYRRMGYTFETESYEDISVEFVNRYADMIHTCLLQPHVQETLAEIQRRGIVQVLLSATGADRLAGQVEQFGLAGYFDEIIGGDNNLAHGKVDKAKALLARSGIQPSEALLIGDTDHDREVAAAVGCQCALLTSGHQLPSHLNTLGVPLLSDVQEVLQCL
ncbi:MAG: HAD family hydrolase [Clostridia bacterium]